jgi:transcriptional regulator with XRE-family HTH domain
VTEYVEDIEGIGERLRHLREQHGYSLRQLAEKAGVSASLISSIERVRVEPSLTTLRGLAAALDVTIAYFLTPPDASSVRVIRGHARPAATRPNATGGTERSNGAEGVRSELASPPEAAALEVTFQRADPGAWLGGPPIHDGEEWGMVLAGRIKVIVGEEVHFLNAGDSIWFPGSIPHRMANIGTEVAEYIWIDIPWSR